MSNPIGGQPIPRGGSSASAAEVQAALQNAVALHQHGQLVEAERIYRNILKHAPDHFDATRLLGIVLLRRRQFVEGEQLIARALKINPNDPSALNNRGSALQELKRYDEALASFDKAIVLKPDYAAAFYNRGNVLRELKRFDEALASYDKAITLRPDHAETCNACGIVLNELNRFDEALASFDKAIALKPDYADAFNNQGLVLKGLQRFDEAMLSYERAIAVSPDHRHAFSGLAECALKICDWTRALKLADEIKVHVAETKSIVQPFVLLGYCDGAALQLKCAQSCIKDRVSTPVQPLWNGKIWDHDKIRVAYLSSDFRRHPLAYLTAELYELHDRARFEVLGISFGPDDRSEIRSRLVDAFDQFRDVRMQSDHDIAKLLNELEVDIAVDLTGHTANSRPKILAHRPAPIQVSYMGYPGTMGAKFIDYVIADRTVLPFDQQPFWTEAIVHHPDTYWVTDSKTRIAPRNFSRSEVGLPENGFVFCCFNNSYKITASVFDVWMRLLRAIDGSILWLLQDNSSAEASLRKEAAARGIDPARLVFANRMPIEDHLARHRLADVFLDTLPINAHTTASDALWTGLPLVTCRGNSFAGRVAASLLNAVGLPELVTSTLEEYEALALALARDAHLLATIKAKLARNRDTCPLFNSKRFTRHLEAAYTRMWEFYQRGEGPRSFSVAPKLD